MKHLTRLLVFSLVAVILTLTLFTAMAESGIQGLFPQFNEIFNDFPSLADVVNRPADREETLEDGSRRLTWEQITAEDFDAFSVYLSEQGCTIDSYDIQNNIFTATIRAEQTVFIFAYDQSSATATLTYPNDEAPVSADEPEAAADASETPAFAVAVGDVITFGHYEQDNRTSNGPEPVEWIVLNVDSKKQQAFVISKYVLDSQHFNDSDANITWENCTLRKWLNREFLNKAFTADEQEAILTTNVPNGRSQRNPRHNTNGGNDTQDKIYLMSYAEVMRYFPADDETRICTATDYAVSNGISTTLSETYAYGGMLDGKYTSTWLLRSPGPKQNYTCCVERWCFIGNARALYTGHGVRPVMNIDLTVLAKTASVKTDGNEQNQSGLSDLPVAIGDAVIFGHYEQDNHSGNGEEPIEWVVLDVDPANHRVLLVSKQILDEQPYHSADKGVAWEACTLRSWLNQDFLNAAFTADEQELILWTPVDNSNDQKLYGSNARTLYGIDGGSNTQDKLFILSYLEAKEYFLTKEDRLCAPTDYARAVYSDEHLGMGRWWLRTHGKRMKEAGLTGTDGSINSADIVYYNHGIRPAMYVSLDAGIF